MTRNKELDRQIGRVVKLLGKATGWPMTRLAKEIGWSYAALNSRLAGETQFTAAEIQRLATHFDVDPGVFFRPPLDLVAPATVPGAALGLVPSTKYQLPRSGHVAEAGDLDQILAA